MSDQLIVVGVVLLALAVSFVLFSRKTDSGRPSLARVPQLPRLDDASVAKKHSSRPPAKKHSSRPPAKKHSSRPPAKKHSSRPPASTEEIEADDVTELPAAAASDVSPLLAEMLAETHEAYATGKPAPEPEEPAALIAARSRGSKPNFIYEGGAEQDEQTGPLARVLIQACGDTDRGLKRARNEDAILLMPEHGLFAVADGMGGYQGGQVASSLAIDSLRETFETPPAPEVAEGAPRRAAEVATAMQRANQAVFRAARSQSELRDMGTTLVALRFMPNKQRLYVGHVGDSRCYRLRNGELRQLTTDHALKELGLTGPRENDLFKAIGIEKEVAVDVVVDKPLPGDVYWLCSDGLPKMVGDDRIRELLLKEDDAEAAVYSLIEQANDAGGKDNVTVLLAKVSSAQPEPRAVGA